MANFQRVRNDFLLSLPPAERQLFSSFPSSGQMLDEIRQWDVIQRKQFTGAKLFSNIKKFSDGIQPYFDIVGLVVSSHPECAALAWGGLRLVLKVCLCQRHDCQDCSYEYSWQAILHHSSRSLPTYLSV